MIVKYFSAALMILNCMIIGAVVRNQIKDLSDRMVFLLTVVAIVQVVTSSILTILILAGI